MSELPENKANDSLDALKPGDLENAFSLADSIVTKNYLSQLSELSLIDKTEELERVDLTQHVALFRVRKIVYDRNENNLQKLINTYATSIGFQSNIVMIINSTGNEVELYLGTSGATEMTGARSTTQALCNSFIGNFPGSIDSCDTKLLDNDELKALMNSCTQDLYRCVSSVSGVASTRDKDDVPNANYVQGIEKLLDTMQGKVFSAIFIANLIPINKLEDIKAEYELLYTNLAPFLKSDLTFNESSAEGVSETLSKSLSNSVTKSQSSALSMGVSEGNSHTEGEAVTNTNTVGANAGVHADIPGTNIGVHGGGSYSHSKSRTKSVSDTSTFGTTQTQSNTIGTSMATAEINSISNGKSKTKTTGRSLQLSYTNKTVQNLLDKIDEQLVRIKDSENYGIFASAAYFLAADPVTAKMASSTYKALISGTATHVENAKINFWTDENNVRIIENYLRKLEHPQFSFIDGNVVTPASLISGRELAVQMGLPRKSVPGISVVETAAFGRNIARNRVNGNRNIELGKLYHMGRDEESANGELPVTLDLDSLTAHTFITGSTGSGKSNAIYSILERILNNNKGVDDCDKVHFMVIEPAKGEYKDKFGHKQGVTVYSTNKKKASLLRINPFSFPEDVHVLEHIDRLIEIFNVCWPMYAAMPAVLKDAIERSYINAGWDLTESVCKYEARYGRRFYPSFIDVLKMVNIVMEESKYSSDSKGDYTGALCTRLKSLTNGIYGQIFTQDELSSKELFDSDVIVDLSRVGSTETKALIMGMLIMKLQEYRMSEGIGSNSRLRHLTILEEAHNLLKRTSTEQNPDSSNLLGKSVEMLANSIAEMRTYGEGFIIADQAPGLLDMSAIRNTNTKIILRLPDMDDRVLVGKAAALNDSQIDELSKLETGVAAVYQNNWLEPVLCHIHPSQEENELFNYDSKKDQTDNNEAVLNLVKYVMLPLPEKLKLKKEELDNLRDSVFKLQISSDTRLNLLKYFEEENIGNIQRLRNKILYGLFNSETALALSNIERTDISAWTLSMLENLCPSIDEFDKDEQEKILSSIVYEGEKQIASPEVKEISHNFLNFMNSKGKGR